MRKVNVNFKSHWQEVEVRRLSLQERCEEQLRGINAKIAEINQELRAL